MSNLDDAALIEACRAIMETHAHAFSRAARFFPGPTRDAVAVLYAFCRMVDDAVDDAPSPEAATAAVAELRAELAGTAPARPVIAAVIRWCTNDSLARAAADELVTGVASDVVCAPAGHGPAADAAQPGPPGPRIIPDDAALVQYAYRVAGTVGLLMCALLDVRDPAAHAFAIDLGIGMQLTNICRDVREDAALGRVYLPATRLAAVGVTPAEVLAGTAPRTALAGVVRDVLALADRYYTSANFGLHHLPREVRAAVVVASRLYRAIGRALGHWGYDAWRGRAFVTPAERRVLIARGLAATVRWSWPTPGHAHDDTLHAALVGLPGIRATRDTRGRS